MTKDPNKRLGCCGTGEQGIKDHPFFRPVDWDALEKRRVTPPFKPKIVSFILFYNNIILFCNMQADNIKGHLAMIVVNCCLIMKSSLYHLWFMGYLLHKFHFNHCSPEQSLI